MSIHIKRSILLAILLLATAALFNARPALAAGVVGNGTPGSCTEAALNTALTGGGKITFNCGAGNKTIVLTAQKNIVLNTTIDGGGKIILRASGGQHFLVDLLYVLTLKNITLRAGSSVYAGSVENFGTLKATNVKFIDNHSVSFHGGAIVNYGTAIIKNSIFTDNRADQRGGAIFSNGPVLTIKNSTFTYNNAEYYGGAVQSEAGEILVTGSTFAHNFTTNSTSGGGGLNLVYPTTGTIRNSTMDDNYATDGGGIASNGDITVANSKIINNGAAQFGGGIWQGGNMTVIDSTLDNNTSDIYGGGIYTTINPTTISNSTLSNNKAVFWGGGLHSTADVVVTNTTFSGNSAGTSGSAILRAQGNIDLQHVTIANNPTLTTANGINSYGAGTLYMQNSVLSNNGMGNCGGAGAFSSYGNNLSNDGTCAFLTVGGDMQNKGAKLGALANNGGPTMTHLPLANSKLINKGTNVGVVDDQRGLPRPVGANPDIGAIEVQ